MYNAKVYVSSYIKSWKKIQSLSKEQYEIVIKEYPILSMLYTMIKDFYRIIFSQKVEELESWIAQSKKLDISEIQSFIEGLCKDIEAVKNGIAYQYNNV